MLANNDYVEYKIGTIPLIISVPHGGKLECPSIPKRVSGVLGIDKGTIELTRDILEALETITKGRTRISHSPSHIISHVRRNKIDMNRSMEKAYVPMSNLAMNIYRFYHDKIRESILENIKRFHYSLLIDVHGFESHKRPQGFRDVDLILGTNNLQSLFSTPVQKKDWNKNIRGKLVKKFLELNVPIAPGHQRRREYVLKGGFTTLAYGASKIPGSQVIQIEFSERIRYRNEKLKKLVVTSLAEVLIDEISTLDVP